MYIDGRSRRRVNTCSSWSKSRTFHRWPRLITSLSLPQPPNPHTKPNNLPLSQIFMSLIITVIMLWNDYLPLPLTECLYLACPTLFMINLDFDSDPSIQQTRSCANHWAKAYDAGTDLKQYNGKCYNGKCPCIKPTSVRFRAYHFVFIILLEMVQCGHLPYSKAWQRVVGKVSVTYIGRLCTKMAQPSIRHCSFSSISSILIDPWKQ